ncbi:Glycosyltransferase family 9 (heptosyltransferase) [Entomobacter blattae]|uniref:Glycosyltransferase family 9 (Heptosyltransferase) n=1 Tax=Entomobacter blattae TaxID=2762277 RepID=A0A7H1NUW5_9PROT|nr:Glycosyltransferase family 9 (heptosyltransferase) [Entomobacter blattae]
MIRLGALGDFVLSFSAFAAIRKKHQTDHITLLTTRPYVDLAQRSPWFDTVLIDSRPKWWQISRVWTLHETIKGFDFVYDLQTSSRSSFYYYLAGRPLWSGIAQRASHRHRNPHRNFMHTLDRQKDQLVEAGITEFPVFDLSWLAGPISSFGLPQHYSLFVPGAAPHRPAKRWPAAYFGHIAAWLEKHYILRTVVVGSAADKTLAEEILSYCSSAIDLTGKTALTDLAALAAKAHFALGNDTGPMHMAALMGCPCVVLFSQESKPELTAPRGQRDGQVRVLKEPDLANLSEECVKRAISEII